MAMSSKAGAAGGSGWIGSEPFYRARWVDDQKKTAACVIPIAFFAGTFSTQRL
jgi:hypothetical protein